MAYTSESGKEATVHCQHHIRRGDMMAVATTPTLLYPSPASFPGPVRPPPESPAAPHKNADVIPPDSQEACCNCLRTRMLKSAQSILLQCPLYRQVKTLSTLIHSTLQGKNTAHNSTTANPPGTSRNKGYDPTKRLLS